MKHGLSEEVYKKIKTIIKKNKNYKFKLFGSRARGDYQKTSDIDLAIFENVSKEDKYKIQNEIDLNKAITRLGEALAEEPSPIVIDGVLHRFELTFELAWKTMKDYLEYVGIIEKTGSPREVIQMAFSNGLIQEGEKWIQMMLARNSLSHLYDEEKSREIYEEIKKDYFNLLQDLNKILQTKL